VPDNVPKVSVSARKIPLAYRAGSHLGFALRRAVTKAVDEQRIGPLAAPIERELGDHLLALNTKHSGFPVVLERLQRNWQVVRERAIQRDPSLDGYALDVAKTETQQLVVDTESLFTMLRSTLDIAIRLTRFVERRLLRLPPRDRSTDSELWALPGLQDDQRQQLITVRDRFIHEAPPWFEVILAEGSAPDLAILVSREADYTAGTGYVLLSQLGALYQGIETHLDAVETLLVRRVDGYGKGG